MEHSFCESLTIVLEIYSADVEPCLASPWERKAKSND
jgi:hypothetical protein